VAQTLGGLHNHKHREPRIRKLLADFREHLLHVLLLRLQFATTVYTLLTLQLFCDRIRSYRRKSLAYPLPQSLQQSQGILTILEVQVDFVGATAAQPNYRRSILRLVSVHAHKASLTAFMVEIFMGTYAPSSLIRSLHFGQMSRWSSGVLQLHFRHNCR
jgi:hypothetical protein